MVRKDDVFHFKEVVAAFVIASTHYFERGKRKKRVEEEETKSERFFVNEKDNYINEWFFFVCDSTPKI